MTRNTRGIPAFTKTLNFQSNAPSTIAPGIKKFIQSKDQPTYPVERHRDRDARAPLALFPSCHE
jgi:hypothetical protein